MKRKMLGVFVLLMLIGIVSILGASAPFGTADADGVDMSASGIVDADWVDMPALGIVGADWVDMSASSVIVTRYSFSYRAVLHGNYPLSCVDALSGCQSP